MPSPAPWLRISLHDVHPLWGGLAIAIAHGGAAHILDVDRAKHARRFDAALDPAAIAELDRLLGAIDLRTMRIPERPGIPDEARPVLTLTGPDGMHRISKWAGVIHPGFSAIYTYLQAHAALILASGLAPAHEGPLDPASPMLG